MHGRMWAHCNGDQDDRVHASRQMPQDQPAPEFEKLAYKVAVLGGSGTAVETVVAVTLTPGVAYAAYYAALREFLGRDVTLTHNGRTLSHSRPRPS